MNTFQQIKLFKRTIPTHLSTWSIDGLLSGSVGVYGGHETLYNAKLVVDHFSQRSQTVGSAGSITEGGRRGGYTVLLEYFAGEKSLRMSQISRKFDPSRSNYCVLARIVCIY